MADPNAHVLNILKAVPQVTKEGVVQVLEHATFPYDISYAF